MNWIMATILVFLFLIEGAKEVIIKILLPALIGVTIKLATMLGKEKMTWTRVIASYTTGLGSAYLCGSYVLESFSDTTSSIVIASIAIGSERITEYLMYKFDFKDIIDPLIQILLNKFKK
jgi:uncharacterized membrane protein